jgi:hypothetical protein
MFYQCFREKKPHGNHNTPKFDYQDYLSVHEKYVTMPVDQQVVNPHACLGIEAVMAYKLAIRRFHANQRDAQINTNLWEGDIWLVKCEMLLQAVKGYKQQNKKDMFTEKVHHESGP